MRIATIKDVKKPLSVRDLPSVSLGTLRSKKANPTAAASSASSSAEATDAAPAAPKRPLRSSQVSCQLTLIALACLIRVGFVFD
jgi:hypothetical protein